MTINSALTGAGGLDAGSLAANTVYYEHLIYNPTTADAKGLMSLSRTAPTLPAGYTQFARIGGDAITDGSNHFYRTMRRGDDVTFVITPGTNTWRWPMLFQGSLGFDAGWANVNGDLFKPTYASQGASTGDYPGADWAVATLTHLVPASATKGTFGLTNDSVLGPFGAGSGGDSMFATSQYQGGPYSANPCPMWLDPNGNSGGIVMGELVLEGTDVYYSGSNVNCGAWLMGFKDPC